MKLTLLAAFSLALVISALTTGCTGHHPNEMVHYEPGLGEIMSLTSMRHAKLWFAGQGQNWALAEYELEELQEGFEDIAKFHPTHKAIKQPIPQLIAKTMDYPLAELNKAIKAKNVALFTQHFDAVTAGCNACHQLSEFGFNIVTRPAFNPFANQDFTSVTK
ncbi:MAG: hypothetical protein HOP02_15695 [Methylococcaceae bacterium]|nr:hypothetical protein [Methylococcaceae bacterium]